MTNERTEPCNERIITMKHRLLPTETLIIFFFNYPNLKALVILVVISIANAQIRPLGVSSRDRDAIVLKQVYEPNPDGSYVYRYIFYNR